jgi:arylformamidase
LISFQKIVDLSDELYTDMPSWPTSPELKVGPLKRMVRDLAENSIIDQMPMHTGTHVDSPLHFIPDGKSLDKYDVSDFMGEGVVLDFRNKKPGEGITSKDLEPFVDSIHEGDIVMLCTNWSKRKGFNKEYMYMWPYPEPSACDFVASKKVKAVGTEGMSIGPWSGTVPAQGPISKFTSAEVHKALLKEGILVIEGLANLEATLDGHSQNRAFFSFAPLKFKGVEGAPCRAFAFL